MFTGIIQEVGKVKEITRFTDFAQIEIACGQVLSKLNIGDSIAVNGVCLTATKINTVSFEADVMIKTLELTSLGKLSNSDLVNLELAMLASDRFGGHFVQGHVDAVAVVTKTLVTKDWTQIQIKVSPDLLKYIVAQGSICLDGVSLTVGEVAQDLISVWLIPKTLEKTNFADKKIGDVLNVEVDLLAKHVERLMQSKSRDV
ncbi:riboflavin synthase [Candidatus Nanopelagicus abundans]|uniref:Riboflavin synthase n=1 Tax=Candidatus Nanopelagicus abundans TaxID=1884916 RepID=A0A249L5B2_9ACTN|nr:riboflavin synthase [Candidatus Nanopelagicus abundans]ASY24207.1 riboflavin synthase [Candidatus Nanopelagicus abundans]